MKISKIILYDEPTVPEINLANLKNFLQRTFPVEVEIRENILKQSLHDTAKKIAECKVFNLRKDFEKHEPTEEEISFEESNFQDTSNTENIVMYDGFHLQKVLSEIVKEHENQEEIFHVFLQTS